jgi:hypothetical protein
MRNDRIERLVNAARPQPTHIADLMAEFSRIVAQDASLRGMSRSARAGRAALLAELHESNGTAAWIRAARNP